MKSKMKFDKVLVKIFLRNNKWLAFEMCTVAKPKSKNR